MALSWDLTKIEQSEKKCWQPSKEEEGKYELNPVTNALIWSTMMVGIAKITDKTYKEFHQRLLEFQVVHGEGLLMSKIDGENYYRMPSIKEVESHIGLATNVSPMDRKKWGSYLKRMVEEKARYTVKPLHEKMVAEESKSLLSFA